MATAVVELTAPAAADPTLTGAKAANLARAAAAGLPVLPGLVLTIRGAASTDDGLAELRTAWLGIGGEAATVVVRSSSTVEDAAVSSMAGQFRSVLGVRGWDALVAAVGEVLASAARTGGSGPPAPMAVLVQRELDPAVGGVLFGVDPVTGDPHLVVEAVAGSPEALVSGRATAERYVLSPRGRVRRLDGRPPWRRIGNGRRPLLDRSACRALARLAAGARRVLGGPQDVEWGIGRDGTLWLLQSRPVTAVGSAVAATGPVLGPGPVAETFPEPLRPLEADLWLEPLGRGVVRALEQTRAVSDRHLAASPVVTTVRGWPAVDLELFGYVPGPGGRAGLRLLDPRPGARRLRAAVRVGRLRAELPRRVAGVLDRVDGDLADVRPPALLDGRELLELLEASRAALAELHTLEVLAAALVDESPRSLAGEALRALATARAAGLPDDRIPVTRPLVLALTPPRVGDPVPLPPTPAVLGLPPVTGRPGPRELLRLRIRWVQELGARVATELVGRLARVSAPEAAWLTLDELAAVARGEPAPPGLADRPAPPGPPLPALFRLDPDGQVVVAERPGARRRGGGVGAGGGRGSGPAAHGSATSPPPEGSVLVVRTLDPGLAPLLPRLAGLVAETGSTLSHLAILAREQHLPTVVAVHDAVRRFPPGERLLVDGVSGEVRLLPAADLGERTAAP